MLSSIVLAVALKRLVKSVTKIEDYTTDRWMITLHAVAYVLLILVPFSYFIKPKSLTSFEITDMSFIVIDLFASVALALIVN